MIPCWSRPSPRTLTPASTSACPWIQGCRRSPSAWAGLLDPQRAATVWLSSAAVESNSKYGANT
eukprot:3786700-Prymnesium_polylepis.1